MKIEITTEQFNQIQNEIIRLEESLIHFKENEVWSRINTQDKIHTLKKILESEEIDLDELN